MYDDGDTVEVTPTRNEGGRRGFTPIEDETETFVYTSVEQLGTAVVNALSKSV